MRKIIATAWIFSLALLIFPLMSFADGVSERSEVVNAELKAVYENLEAELPILGQVSVDKTILDIKWTGKQNKVLTPSNNHNHHAKVESAYGDVIMLGVSSSGFVIPEIVVKIVVESGEMNEHRAEKEPGEITVDVFFRVKSAVMKIVPIVPIDLGRGMVKIKDGQIQFLKTEGPAAPGKGRACLTTFGRIKSGR
jgi:hypothetical protein